jgi:hypothetical protein
MNFHKLDGAGFACVGWCFTPKGNLVAGDVMLAQKIALVTDEHGTLAVANMVCTNKPTKYASPLLN